jgi:hypothetical protein
MELEMSLITGSPDGEALSARRVYRRARRGALWSLAATVLGAALIVAAFTESLVVAGVGLSIMIASSLALAHHAESMMQASRMVNVPRDQ